MKKQLKAIWDLLCEKFQQLEKKQWILIVFLFFAPFIVAFAQISVLDFPTISWCSSMPYSPYPQVLYLPLLYGVILISLNVSAIFTFTSKRYGKLPSWIKFLVGKSIIVINPILFWFGINLAQRAVILEYLGAVNANGLHFLRIFLPPLWPEVFLNDGIFAFIVTIVIGIVGVLIMVKQYTVLFSSTNKTSLH